MDVRSNSGSGIRRRKRAEKRGKAGPDGNDPNGSASVGLGNRYDFIRAISGLSPFPPLSPCGPLPEGSQQRKKDFSLDDAVSYSIQVKSEGKPGDGNRGTDGDDTSAWT